MRGLDFITTRFFPKSRRQTYLLLVFGIVLLGGVVLAWYGFFREPSLPVVDNQPPPPKPVEIDFTVFENRVFRQLGAPLPPISLPDELGKRNPFAPGSAPASQQDELQEEPQE